MEQLKLSSKFGGQFMLGYRKWQDQEIVRMLNEDLKNFEMIGTDGDSTTTIQNIEEEPKPG